MNLVLPPRRELPDEVHDRMLNRLVDGMTGKQPTKFDRLRGPLAVAAGVTVLAAGAMMIPQSLTGSDDATMAGTLPTTRSSTTTRPPTSRNVPPPTPLPALPITQQVSKDLDRCGTVAANSPRSREFSPRTTWQPVLAVELKGHRIIGYRDNGIGKPGFCDVTATTATVSDPSAEPMRLYSSQAGQLVDIDAHYLSASGVLVGMALGVSTLELEVRTMIEPNRFLPRTETATVRNQLFAVHVGELKEGDELETRPDGGPGGGMRFDPAKVRPIGATG